MNPHLEPTIFRLSHHPGINPVEFDGIGIQKINYRIHTDAIKDTLIPPSVTKAQASPVSASAADLLNFARRQTMARGPASPSFSLPHPGMLLGLPRHGQQVERASATRGENRAGVQ